MKSKKEQVLLKLQKKYYKWNFKLTFLSSPLIWVRPTPTLKSAWFKLFAYTSYNPHLSTTPLVQQTYFKNMVVPTNTWVLPLAETTPTPDKVRIWSKRGKVNKQGAHPTGALRASYRYGPPQKKRSAIPFMLRMHLKQLKTFMRGITNVLPTVLLPCFVPTYFLNLSLGTNLLPPDRTETIGLWPVGTKTLWGKRGKATSSPGSRVSKANLPRIASLSKKKNSTKGEKLAYTQKDLVNKISKFINIWCYLQMLFFFLHTLKQPMIVLAYPNLRCLSPPAVNSLTSPTYFLSPKRCFLIWVTKLGCCPWRRQPYRIFVPTGFLPVPVLPTVITPIGVEGICRMHATAGTPGTAAYAIAWSSGKGAKVEVLALSFLPQHKLKSWVLHLEERVSEASRRSSISKKKSYVGLFCKQKMLSLQTNNFYKYLGFCDYIIFKMVWKWCSRKHSNQSAQWVRCHYFYKLNGQSWVFALKKILFNPTIYPY